MVSPASNIPEYLPPILEICLTRELIPSLCPAGFASIYSSINLSSISNKDLFFLAKNLENLSATFKSSADYSTGFLFLANSVDMN